MLHVKLYTSNEPLNVGEINSAGPGRPDISMYFFVLPNALSATQLQNKKTNIATTTTTNSEKNTLEKKTSNRPTQNSGRLLSWMP